MSAEEFHSSGIIFMMVSFSGTPQFLFHKQLVSHSSVHSGAGNRAVNKTSTHLLVETGSKHWMTNGGQGGERSDAGYIKQAKVCWGHHFTQCDPKGLFERLTNDRVSECKSLECLPTRGNKDKDPKDLEEYNKVPVGLKRSEQELVRREGHPSSEW
uniref:Uncharacterized protein n=1 Tax=Molossus molossus TaxID=27622 RepID=A0A7J8FS53_MOLMO|nr:hypothetical protein HJG59_008360 [Molossus molossus]